METIIDVNMQQQNLEDLTLYASYVAQHRIMADDRDGLKPVSRAILYAMFHDEKAVSHQTKVKSSAIVGTTMKKYHPHGDASIYDTIKPMANSFEINKPLVVPQGNWGNIDGAPAAASRYTEAYLSQFALDCVIGELQETNQVVDWQRTYDGRDLEPEYLPAMVPLLLINGSFGIGVGLKVEIPRHNINEVIDATINLIRNPSAKVVLIPDHCLKCEIVDTNWKSICNKGFGTYKVRGVIDTIDYNGHPAIIIRSIPDLTFLDKIKAKIEELIKSNVLVQIIDFIDNTPMNSNDLEFIYVLKKGSDPEFVKQVIYKNTEMEQTCRINFEALHGDMPMRYSYKSYLQEFIEFRKDTKFRKYCNVLQKLNNRITDIEPFIRIVKSGQIDKVIALIKKQKGEDDNIIIEKLIKLLNITDKQARYILNSPLKRLSASYLAKYCEEYNQLLPQIEEIKNKLQDPNFQIIMEEIISELEFFKKKYGNPRRCKIIKESETSDIPEGEFKIVISQGDKTTYVKKLQVEDNIPNIKGCEITHVITSQNTDNLIIFDEVGRAFKLPIHKITFVDKRSNGIDIRFLIKNMTSNITNIILESMIEYCFKSVHPYKMITLSKMGYIKKMDLDDFLTIAPSGTMVMKLNEGDSICTACIILDDPTIDAVIYSDTKVLRFSIDQIPHLKRITKGVKTVNNVNYIDGISFIYRDFTDIVVITRRGKVNKIPVAGLQRSNRLKAGHNVIRLSKGDTIVAIYGVTPNNIISWITAEGDSGSISVNDIPMGSTISAGTKLVSTTQTNFIAKVTLQ